MDTVVYVHGKGGNAQESAHYEPLFPDCKVVGADYRSSVPWVAAKEIKEEIDRIGGDIILIANSIGAYFSMCAGIAERVKKAFFISPVIDMERMILNLTSQSGVGEEDLKNRGVIPTAFGEDLSWEYLCYVRENKVVWFVPTAILYGEKDNLVEKKTVEAFAKKVGASLTVMDGGEHWFHTEEQMRFLDDWIRGER